MCLTYLQEFTHRIDQFLRILCLWQAAPHGISKYSGKSERCNSFMLHFNYCTIKNYMNLCVELNRREKQKMKQNEQKKKEKERNQRRKLEGNF